MTSGAVQITPESEICFELSQKESSPKALITLKHPGGKVGPIAFKVRLFNLRFAIIYKLRGDPRLSA